MFPAVARFTRSNPSSQSNPRIRRGSRISRSPRSERGGCERLSRSRQLPTTPRGAWPAALSVAAALAAACGGGGGSGAPRPVTLTAESFNDTSWSVVSVEGATVPVSGAWNLRADGTYDWSFHAPPVYDLEGNGSFTFDGTTLRVTGVIADYIVSSGVIPIEAYTGELRFRDDDGDQWVYSGQWSETAGSGPPPGGACIAVQQGPWEFDLSSLGIVVVSFVDGDLRQSGCTLTYDDDNVFSGPLEGATWTATSPLGISFRGAFSGSPPRRFRGQYTASNGQTGSIDGLYVGG